MAAIDDLLASAERIAHFGVQSGRISDTRLLVAIGDAQAAKAANQLTSGGKEATALAAAVQDAARLISPTTVAELSRGWDPFATPPVAPGPTKRSPAKWATLVGMVMLVFAAGYYTLWHKRATALLTFAVDEAVNAQNDAVHDMVLPMLAQLTQDPAAGTDTSPIEGAILLKHVDRIQDIQHSIDLFESRFDSLYRDRIILWGQALDLADAVWPSDAEGASATPPGAANAQDADGAGEASASIQAKIDLIADACGAPEADEAARLQMASFLAGFNELRTCAMRAMEVEPLTGDQLLRVRMQLFGFDHAMSVIGSWLLPAIYGALGALIYYMRQFLDPLRQDPPFERVLMRVSLGAFAGITVGWFFTPTTASQGFQFPDVGMATLTFAFILGFSIEVFFGFLERLVNLANDGISRLGKPS
jgi:hypothetical protein